uniref:uncharacterized protein LOC122594577 n=1 Tax=Erigeron canadensis TaxID=72917 RepID=UPI001CB932CF|nr:uncharacterized protein LOC122594577 [Erigeron canadensis]
MSPLANRKQTTQNISVGLHGPFQDAMVIVEFVAHKQNDLRLKGDDNGVANAFTGPQWKTFNSDNVVQQGFWLLFEKNKRKPHEDFSYKVFIFIRNRISLWTETIPRCTIYKHLHNNHHPRFHKILPSNFVLQHKLYNYTNVILQYGHLQFHASIQIKQFPNQEHTFRLQLISDWQDFLDQTGLTAQTKLRFELLTTHNAAAGSICFEVY